MNGLKTIILAAGRGTRVKSKIPKVLHKILGKEMILYIIDAVRELNSEIMVVVGHEGDVIKNSIENVRFIDQKEILGTGHAVIQAKDYIDDKDSILILCGDTPLVTSKTLNDLIEYHKKNNSSATVVTTVLEDPKEYGRIIKENGKFLKIVEYKDSNRDELLVKEVNTGIYYFKGKALNFALSRLNVNSFQNEYYITDVIEILGKDGFKIDTMLVSNSEEFYGVNSRVELHTATNIMKSRINKKHMENGVTIINSDTTYIGPNVVIGKDTIIYPNVIIEGDTVIGEDCIIGSNTKIISSCIKNSITIENSVILESRIDNNSKIGPFAYLRPKSDIGKDVKIGDFVEIKNTKIGNNTKASHLTYLGDSVLGDNINIGCGTITVNYDGKNKFKTIIKDNSFIGCNTNLIAPIIVQENAYVAAGSTITENVPEYSLSIARSRQINKENWNIKKRNKY